MPKYTDDQIREHAHCLWKKAGEPEGQADIFWQKAKSELEADAPGDDTPAPMPE